MEAVQMNTRLPKDLKSNGDLVLERHGITPSQAVRALWKYTVVNGAPPDFVTPHNETSMDDEVKRKLELVRSGAGLAVSKAIAEYGFDGELGNLLEGKTWDEIKDEMYDEMLDDMRRACM